MKKLAKPFVQIVVSRYGTMEFLRRISDPLYFQAFANLLGYDWNSSGISTVLCGVLKEALDPNVGIMVAGGKGKASLRTPQEIRKIGRTFNLSNKKRKRLVEASKKAAKIDNAVLQDGHTLYHHSFFIAKDGAWAIVQQGMNTGTDSARRYHWSGEEVTDFVLDPHEGISAESKREEVLNLPSEESIETQKTSVDLVKEGVDRVRNDVAKLHRKMKGIPSLNSFLHKKDGRSPSASSSNVQIQHKAFKVNWKHLPWDKIEQAYELQPANFEELIQIRGMGPKTIRALALTSELIYEADLSWKDPARYSFAHGGKDGVPYPVETDRIEKVAAFLREIVQESHIGREEKKETLKNLAEFSNK